MFARVNLPVASGAMSKYGGAYGSPPKPLYPPSASIGGTMPGKSRTRVYKWDGDEVDTGVEDGGGHFTVGV